MEPNLTMRETILKYIPTFCWQTQDEILSMLAKAGFHFKKNKHVVHYFGDAG